MGPLEEELNKLRDKYPGLAATQLPSGATLIRIPAIALPAGWSKPSTSVTFIAPQGYPFAAPDCFWADSDLRVDNNAMPQNAQMNAIPETPETTLWFSWHLSQPWNPNRDSLFTWMGVILQRLNRAA